LYKTQYVISLKISSGTCEFRIVPLIDHHT
jgi:hypothetical protein